VTGCCGPEPKFTAHCNRLSVPFRPTDWRQPFGASDDLHRGAIQSDLSCTFQLGVSLPGHVPGAGVQCVAGICMSVSVIENIGSNLTTLCFVLPFRQLQLT